MNPRILEALLTLLCVGVLRLMYAAAQYIDAKAESLYPRLKFHPGLGRKTDEAQTADLPATDTH